MRGWREAEDGWQKQNHRRKKKVREQITSFYVANFPEGVSSIHFREVFSPLGKLRDVYIPKKKDCYGSPFAFIRYADVVDPDEMVVKMKQVKMENVKLSINIAKHGR